ncbi:hypothetical protein DV736_g5460, partial [Chaetothyriales sp. CBS 134916]
MNSASPLLRTLESVIHGPRSRIPHIAAHIVQRRASCPSATAAAVGAVSATKLTIACHGTATNPRVRCSLRHASTIAFQEGIREEDRDDTTKAKGLISQDTSRGHSLASETLADIVAQGHPERILHALCHPELGPPFIQAASDQDFARVLECLDPAYFLDERKKIDRDINPRLYFQFAIRRAGSLGDKFDWHLRFLEHVVKLRRAAGFRLTLDVYKQLLKWAETVGSESLARDLLDSAMPRDGVEPDLAAYNSYLGACVWNGAYDIDFRYRRRNSASNFLLRERVMPLKDGDKIVKLTRPRYQRPEGTTLRDHALAVFDRLTRQGHAPDEATFTNLMLAMAYDGDMQGVKSVLKSTWNIDVDLLSKYDEEEIESPTFYEDGHRLRPSARLLHAVVYAYGTNNDSFHASYLLDYISRNYNIVPVPDDIWMLLYELTYVLAQRFGRNRTRKGHAVGRLPEDALARLGAVIMDEPHNVRVDTWMLTRLATNARKSRRRFNSTLEAFRDACKLREEHLTRVSKLYDEMLAECDLLRVQPARAIPPARFLDKRREFILESLKLDRDLEGLRQEFKGILLSGWQFNISPWATGYWPVYTLPKLIKEFTTFLPTTIKVEASQFEYTMEDLRWHHERAITDAQGQFDVKAAQLRNLLDHDDTATLIWNGRGAGQWVRRVEACCLVCHTRDQHASADCPRWELGLAGHGLQYGVEAVVFADPPPDLDGRSILQ